MQGGNMDNGQLPPLDPAKIVRGSQLVGQTILDPRSQKLGVIKDILVDAQTARVAYVLVAQVGSDANADWVVIPFPLLQLSADSRASQPIFILNFDTARLRAAPHMRMNAWETIRDPRFIGQVQQFYRPTEHTARRPNRDMDANGRANTQPGQMPQGREGQQPTPGAPQPGAPRNQPPTPGATTPGKTAPDAGPPQPKAPDNRQKPNLKSEKGKQAAPEGSKAEESGGKQREEAKDHESSSSPKH
jgi:sporulation protein YlmC with PRC-barrel domain